jgi:GNAT superfamily N-acetyltransferase
MAELSVGGLETLQAGCVEEAAGLAAAAFVNSPAYAYIFEALDESARLKALTWLFEVNIRLRLDSGAARCAYAQQAGGRAEMVCFFMMLPPNSEEIGTWAMVANGILGFPFRFGFQAFWRLLEVKARHDHLEHTFLEARSSNRPFCRLERMVVHPSWQGKGVGSRILGNAIAEATSKGYGVKLSTQEALNVTFYSRLGFAVVGEPEPYFASLGKAYTNYEMAIEPPEAIP